MNSANIARTSNLVNVSHGPKRQHTFLTLSGNKVVALQSIADRMYLYYQSTEVEKANGYYYDEIDINRFLFSTLLAQDIKRPHTESKNL